MSKRCARVIGTATYSDRSNHLTYEQMDKLKLQKKAFILYVYQTDFSIIEYTYTRI